MTIARILCECKVYKLETFQNDTATFKVKHVGSCLCRLSANVSPKSTDISCRNAPFRSEYGVNLTEDVRTAITSMVDAAWNIQTMILNH